MTLPGTRRAIAVASHRGGFLLSLLLIAVLAVACGGDGDDDVVPEDNAIVEGAPPTPTAGVPPAEEAEEATITISGGAFSADSLTVQQSEPTVVHFDNQDDQAYRIRFGDVVAMEEIPAMTVSNIGFNAPNPVEIDGELLAADSDTVLDTIQFIVQAPSGASP